MTTDFTNKQGTGIVKADNFQSGITKMPTITARGTENIFSFQLSEDSKAFAAEVDTSLFEGNIQVGDYIQVFSPITSEKLSVYGSVMAGNMVAIVYQATAEQKEYPVVYPAHDVNILVWRL